MNPSNHYMTSYSFTFLEAVRHRILLFDGAMGTEIQRLNPQPADFPEGKDGFNDGLILSKPEWIKQIHRSYLRAGADCIETNTFGSNQFKLAEYGYGAQTNNTDTESIVLAHVSIFETLWTRSYLSNKHPMQTKDILDL